MAINWTWLKEEREKASKKIHEALKKFHDTTGFFITDIDLIEHSSLKEIEKVVLLGVKIKDKKRNDIDLEDELIF